MPYLLLAQGDTKPRNIGNSIPFISGNDTLLSNAKLTSIPLPMGRFVGRIGLGFEMSCTGDSAGTIVIYYKSRLSGLSWGVPFDSLGVDSLVIARVDSADYDGVAFWINMADLAWWGWHDEGQIIIDAPADLDSVFIKCRLRGQ